MELILVILLFSISAAVCLQMFAFASLTARQAEELSYATLAARSAAECYQATGGDLEQVATILSGSATENILQVNYDDLWVADGAAAGYQLELSHQGDMAEIQVWKLGEIEPIYGLTVYLPGGGVE